MLVSWGLPHILQYNASSMHNFDISSNFFTMAWSLFISWFIASTFASLATLSFASYIPARESLLLYQNDVLDEILSINSSASNGDEDTKAPRDEESNNLVIPRFEIYVQELGRVVAKEHPRTLNKRKMIKQLRKTLWVVIL